MGQNFQAITVMFGAATSVSATILSLLKDMNEWVREISPSVALCSGILAIFVAIKHLTRKDSPK